MKIRLGSRKSNLALYQTRRVASALEEHDSSIETEIVTKETLGDQVQDQPIPDIGEKGLFTAALEKALIAEQIDCAVHSLKDLPSELPEGLEFAGTLQRGNPSDAFVSNTCETLADVKAGETIATGSRRRQGQLNEYLDSVEIVGVRGNIETRLQKLDDSDWKGLIMASTALERLGMEDRIAQELDPTTFIPAASQAAIGIEIKSEREQMRRLLTDISHTQTLLAVRAERQFLRRLEGGCSVPIGVHARRENEAWSVYGWVGSLDGEDILRDIERGHEPLDLADALAGEFLERGAEEIIAGAVDDR
jgi:hydroxymethylbilane synthase